MFCGCREQDEYKYWDIPPLGRRGVYKVKTRALYEKEDKKLFAQVSEYFRNGLIPQSAIRFSMDNSVCEKLYNARLMLLMSFVENNFEDPYELSKIENKKDSR